MNFIIAASTYTSVLASCDPLKEARLTLFSSVLIRYLSEDGIRDFKLTKMTACSAVMFCHDLFSNEPLHVRYLEINDNKI